MTIDNKMIINPFVVQKWKRIPNLLCFEIVGMFATFDIKNHLMLKCMIEFEGLWLEEWGRKLVNMAMIVITSSKAIKQVLPYNSEKKLHFFLLALIVLPIKLTLLSSLY
jgi:hypothetical protein